MLTLKDKENISEIIGITLHRLLRTATNSQQAIQAYDAIASTPNYEQVLLTSRAQYGTCLDTLYKGELYDYHNTYRI